MNKLPLGSLVHKSTKSAGARSSGCRISRSPTLILCDFYFLKTPPCRSKVRYYLSLISWSLFARDRSSRNSLIIVTASTKTSGATKEIKKPTRKAGMIWDSAIIRKNRLKKYLNWLNRTTGMKEYHVYLQLLIELEEKRWERFLLRSKKMLRSCDSSISCSSASFDSSDPWVSKLRLPAACYYRY